VQEQQPLLLACKICQDPLSECDTVAVLLNCERWQPAITGAAGGPADYYFLHVLCNVTLLITMRCFEIQGLPCTMMAVVVEQCVPDVTQPFTHTLFGVGVGRAHS
jgi:hypothetical protein